ncbi:MAG: hypothetical protein NT098_04710 [Candidatus Parcubacteria bacterium]|nr:hypothetical protein [Candidatus Parcubacteria bacterium]
MIHFVPIIFLYSALFALGGAIVFGLMFRTLRNDGAALFFGGDTFSNSRMMLIVAMLFAMPFFGNAESTAFEYLVDFMEVFALWAIWAFAFATVVEKRLVSWKEFLPKKKEERKVDPKWQPKKTADKKPNLKA